MICQVCYLNEAKGVFASQLGPCSNSLCEKCLENKAEIKGFCELLEEKDCYNSDIYRNNLLKCTVFHHGDYLSWDEYKKKYSPKALLVKCQFCNLESRIRFLVGEPELKGN